MFVEVTTNRHGLIKVEPDRHMVKNRSCLAEYCVAQAAPEKRLRYSLPALVTNRGSSSRDRLSPTRNHILPPHRSMASDMENCWESFTMLHRLVRINQAYFVNKSSTPAIQVQLTNNSQICGSSIWVVTNRQPRRKLST